MIRRPTTLLSQLYQYFRYGRGWLLCTMVEMEIFGMSSNVRPDGTLGELSEEQKDPYNPKNLPDFAVMTVRTFLSTQTCSTFDRWLCTTVQYR